MKSLLECVVVTVDDTKSTFSPSELRGIAILIRCY